MEIIIIDAVSVRLAKKKIFVGYIEQKSSFCLNIKV
jgi:hypothetical protein